MFRSLIVIVFRGLVCFLVRSLFFLFGICSLGVHSCVMPLSPASNTTSLGGFKIRLHHARNIADMIPGVRIVDVQAMDVEDDVSVVCHEVSSPARFATLVCQCS